jgi:hypothetical protein
MVSYGLDDDLKSKVVKDDKFMKSDASEPIEFTSYAKIGLNNFFNSNPELFLSRLAKGPPP